MIPCGFVPNETPLQQQRMRFEKHRPEAKCIGELQVRTCSCHANEEFMRCTAWSGTFEAAVCTSGCGDKAVFDVDVAEVTERCGLLYARGRQCRIQSQGDSLMESFGWTAYNPLAALDRRLGATVDDADLRRPCPQPPPPGAAAAIAGAAAIAAAAAAAAIAAAAAAALRKTVAPRAASPRTIARPRGPRPDALHGALRPRGPQLRAARALCRLQAEALLSC